jgi:hypothetical protein
MRCGESVYWRFKGSKEWRYGWPSQLSKGFVRMGFWNGNTTTGPIVDPTEIEVR